MRFPLAGVDVEVVDTEDGEATGYSTTRGGIIAVNEQMMAAIDERTQRKIDSIYRPLVVSLPLREKLAIGDDHRAYLARLIRRAIGFDITLRRG
jgi:vacuolar-type H+-ATPase subunit F/Vma7